MASTCGTNSVMHCIVNFPNNTIMVNRDANENNRDAKRQPFGDINNNMAYESEESSSGVFWSLKPCTFLVE